MSIRSTTNVGHRRRSAGRRRVAAMSSDQVWAALNVSMERIVLRHQVLSLLTWLRDPDVRTLEHICSTAQLALGRCEAVEPLDDSFMARVEELE